MNGEVISIQICWKKHKNVNKSAKKVLTKTQ